MLTKSTVNKDDLLRVSNREKLKNVISQLFDDLDMIKRLSAFAAINYIRKGIGYEGYLQDECKKNGTDMAEKIKNLDALSDIAKEYSDIAAFLNKVEDIKKDLRSKDAGDSNSRDGVLLSTYHGAKGLEYDAVFLPECVKGVIPYKKAVLPTEIEEERRLLYVAMTRAKDELFIYTDKNTSPFIDVFLKK